MAFILESPAFTQGEEIPRDYTCEGKNISPPLSWSGIPQDAQSLVLIIDDPDAPDPMEPKMTWVHWVVINIPSQVSSLAEGASPGKLPSSAQEGLNDWKNNYYEGPCPPIGRHRYFHKLYALDITLSGITRLNKAMVEKAMDGHVLAETSIVGTYEKFG